MTTLGGLDLSILNDLRGRYVYEIHRRESFKQWPFKDTDSCNIKSMAEAGFFWCGNENEIDIAACFLCEKVLDGWESTDDPWYEHKKHAPQCAFIKLERPEAAITVLEFIDIQAIFCKRVLEKQHQTTVNSMEKAAEIMSEKINDYFKNRE